MGVVQRAGDGRDDRSDLLGGHAHRVAVPQQAGRVGPVDEVHGDPQLALEVAAVVDPHDVGVPQRGGQVGLSDEALAVVLVPGDVLVEDLQCVAARQMRVAGEVDLTHAAGPQRPNKRVPGEILTLIPRHGPDTTKHGRQVAHRGFLGDLRVAAAESSADSPCAGTAGRRTGVACRRRRLTRSRIGQERRRSRRAIRAGVRVMIAAAPVVRRGRGTSSPPQLGH